ncbi:MAG TPA: cytochrome c biogenesis protein CcsA [Anaerolineaceae bacterium]
MFKNQPRALILLNWISLGMLVAAILMVFGYAPVEAVMGPVQKIFYFHVATAWVGMLGFLVAVISGIAYLIRPRKNMDISGLAAIEIGLVFLAIAIVTGSIWARPAWGTWWTWDPRLTTASIVELVYLAYLMLRQGIEDPDRRARFGAVYAILGFISVPLTFISIRLFRTIHPVLIGSSDPSAQGTFNMTPSMLQTFLFSLLTFSVLFATLLWHRIRLGQLEDRVDQMKMQAE